MILVNMINFFGAEDLVNPFFKNEKKKQRISKKKLEWSGKTFVLVEYPAEIW